MSEETLLMHATCVALDGKGILLFGPSGSGKSTLALRLLDYPGIGSKGEMLRARLVSDDQVQLWCRQGSLSASPPAPLAGLLEVRGIGVVEFPYDSEAKVVLCVDLLRSEEAERMPEPDDLRMKLLGAEIYRIRIDPQDPAAPARIRVALQHVQALANDRCASPDKTTR